MRRETRYLIFGLFLMVAFMVMFPFCLMAQTGSAATPAPLNLTGLGTAAVIATVVAGVLQGIKQLVPALGGWGARIVAFGMAAAGVVITAPAGQSPIITAGYAVTAALGAAGIHGLVKAASGTAGSGGTPSAT